MTEQNLQTQIINLDKAIQNLKENQKLIMDVLTSDLNNGLTNKDLSVVRWAYSRRFDMMHRQKQNLLKKIN